MFSGWAFLVLAGLSVLHLLNFEYFFLLCLVGFTIIVLAIGPYTVRPAWKFRASLAVLAGAVVFAAIVAVEVLDIVGIHLFS